MTRRNPRGLRPDEKQLWDKVQQSTVPLHPTTKQVVEQTVLSVNRPTRQIIDIPEFRIGQKTGQPDMTAQPQTAAPLRMDSKIFGRLKKGKLSPDARIDLHGMTQDQAYPALVGFILKAHGDGRRLVLVITGKGREKTDDGPIPVRLGVLKHRVPQWLQQSPLGTVVQQITPAHQRHGGGGALYVYLRRSR